MSCVIVFIVYATNITTSLSLKVKLDDAIDDLIDVILLIKIFFFVVILQYNQRTFLSIFNHVSSNERDSITSELIL